jgi:DNA-binding GntR family transcriptional regulator
VLERTGAGIAMSQTKGREKGSLSIVPVQRATMQEDVYQQAKQLILNGELAPGQSITIQWLADAFGVSAMPVREAILRLTAEKALTVVAGRSLGIPPLSRIRLDDLTRTRLEVEKLAVRWATTAITSSAVVELDGLVAKMDAIGTSHEARKIYLRANREFHFAVYRASGSDILMGIIEGLWLQISPYFNLLQERGNYAVSNQHHKALVKALRRTDVEAAAEALHQDIRNAANLLQSMTF